MSPQQNNKALITAINHSNMSNGEVVIKLNNEFIAGNLRSIQLDLRAQLNGYITEFTITGLLVT